jgi:hypothetical protein
LKKPQKTLAENSDVSVFQKNHSVPADYDCIKQWRLAIEIPLTIAPTIPTNP